ncbi:MAG: hypothetical protein V1770_06375 [bacterium]
MDGRYLLDIAIFSFKFDYGAIVGAIYKEKGAVVARSKRLRLRDKYSQLKQATALNGRPFL